MTLFAIGQDSHAFERKYDPRKPLTLGGLVINDVPLTLRANSDGDVILHALTNALSGITCKNVLGEKADALCKTGVTDSSEYLKVALTDLAAAGYGLVHVSVSVEAAAPKLSPYVRAMRKKIAGICGLSEDHVGLTATSGEKLTSFGKGKGIQVFCAVTVSSF
jgi:2-C-methyl-D-erythritol 2,4-cyclodiphosphate synthase